MPRPRPSLLLGSLVLLGAALGTLIVAAAAEIVIGHAEHPGLTTVDATALCLVLTAGIGLGISAGPRLGALLSVSRSMLEAGDMARDLAAASPGLFGPDGQIATLAAADPTACGDLVSGEADLLAAAERAEMTVGRLPGPR